MTAAAILSLPSPLPSTTVPASLSPSSLSSAEAVSRLKRFGPNSMPDTSAHLIRSALSKFWAPVPWVLGAVIVLELGLPECPYLRDAFSFRSMKVPNPDWALHAHCSNACE